MSLTLTSSTSSGPPWPQSSKESLPQSASAGSSATLSSVAAAEKVPAKKRRLQWQEALLRAQGDGGALRLCWTPLYEMDPLVLAFERTFAVPLVSLRLIGVELRALPEEIGEALPTLQVLSLENNQLTRLPDSLTKLLQLRELGLAYNALSALPERLGHCHALRQLTLNNNALEALPVTFAALCHLTRVDVEHNALRVLPENLDGLVACEALNLNKNKLSRLPRCLARMPALTSLSASWNEITYIPQELCASRTLQVLRLSRNAIRAVPERIGDLSALRELTLDFNALLKLPLSFYKLTRLVTLRVEGNEALSDPPPEVLARGAQAVVRHFHDLFFYDKQARMRHVIYATQSVLAQIDNRRIADPALFHANVLLSLDGRHLIDDTHHNSAQNNTHNNPNKESDTLILMPSHICFDILRWFLFL